MTTFLTDISEVVAKTIEWMGMYLDEITASPALTTICIAVPIVSVAVDLLKRLIRI